MSHPSVVLTRALVPVVSRGLEEARGEGMPTALTNRDD
jgi:hypothetical protein